MVPLWIESSINTGNNKPTGNNELLTECYEKMESVRWWRAALGAAMGTGPWDSGSVEVTHERELKGQNSPGCEAEHKTRIPGGVRKPQGGRKRVTSSAQLLCPELGESGGMGPARVGSVIGGNRSLPHP